MTTHSLLAVLSGLGFGLSLIVAIGAQNVFVLRQGLRREHVGPVVALCAVSDIVLICAGVAGMGALIQRLPWAMGIARYGGAAFLFGYGAMAVRRAIRGGQLRTEGESQSRMTSAATLATAIALTWFNPHVYLDTVILLGSVASAYPDSRWWFALGAAVASIVWFCSLGYGARLLSGVFAQARAWRVLDAGIAVIMVGLGVRLLVG